MPTILVHAPDGRQIDAARLVVDETSIPGHLVLSIWVPAGTYPLRAEYVEKIVVLVDGVSVTPIRITRATDSKGGEAVLIVPKP